MMDENNFGNDINFQIDNKRAMNGDEKLIEKDDESKLIDNIYFKYLNGVTEHMNFLMSGIYPDQFCEEEKISTIMVIKGNQKHEGEEEHINQNSLDPFSNKIKTEHEDINDLIENTSKNNYSSLYFDNPKIRETIESTNQENLLLNLENLVIPCDSIKNFYGGIPQNNNFNKKNSSGASIMRKDLTNINIFSHNSSKYFSAKLNIPLQIEENNQQRKSDSVGNGNYKNLEIIQRASETAKSGFKVTINLKPWISYIESKNIKEKSGADFPNKSNYQIGILRNEFKERRIVNGKIFEIMNGSIINKGQYESNIEENENKNYKTESISKMELKEKKSLKSKSLGQNLLDHEENIISNSKIISKKKNKNIILKEENLGINLYNFPYNLNQKEKGKVNLFELLLQYRGFTIIGYHYLRDSNIIDKLLVPLKSNQNKIYNEYFIKLQLQIKENPFSDQDNDINTQVFISQDIYNVVNNDSINKLYSLLGVKKTYLEDTKRYMKYLLWIMHSSEEKFNSFNSNGKFKELKELLYEKLQHIEGLSKLMTVIDEGMNHLNMKIQGKKVKKKKIRKNTIKKPEYDKNYKKTVNQRKKCKFKSKAKKKQRSFFRIQEQEENTILTNAFLAILNSEEIYNGLPQWVDKNSKINEMIKPYSDHISKNILEVINKIKV